MGKSAGTTREIAIPATVFESLHSEIAPEAGTLETVRALHHAGYRAGLAAAAAMHQETGGDSFALSQAGFWTSPLGDRERTAQAVQGGWRDDLEGFVGLRDLVPVRRFREIPRASETTGK